MEYSRINCIDSIDNKEKILNTLSSIQFNLSNLHVTDKNEKDIKIKNEKDIKILNLSKSIKKLNIENRKERVKKSFSFKKINNKLLEKTDYYYIAKNCKLDNRESLINNQNSFFKENLKAEIEFLKKNNCTNELIEQKINEGLVVKTCHQILKNSTYFPKVLENFHKTNQKLLNIRLDQACYSFTKYKIKSLFINTLAYMNLEIEQAGNFHTQDAKGKDVHLIAYVDRSKQLHLAIWSGQTSDENNDWKIYSGEFYIIQKIYDLTSKNYFVLKNVRKDVANPIYAEYLFNSRAIIDAISQQNIHPFIKSGICPILTTIEKPGFNGSILPKMDGDGIDFIANWGKSIEMSQKEFLLEFLRLINVLITAHDMGIHYGDFKLENFLFKIINGKVQFFLSDWDGCLQYREKTTIEFYSKGLFPGLYTPEYCHPNDLTNITKTIKELFSEINPANIDEAGEDDDNLSVIQEMLENKVVYSIGVTLWKILTYKTFNKISPVPTYEEVTHKNNLDVFELKKQWSTEFISLLLWMLNPYLSDRPTFDYISERFEKFIQ